MLMKDYDLPFMKAGFKREVGHVVLLICKTLYTVNTILVLYL